MPFITAENAVELANRANEVRRLKRQRLSQPIAFQSAILQDRYTIRRLMRVRRQIELLSDMLEQAKDIADPLIRAQVMDRHTSGLSRLAEQERQLANRPLPGSWKPQAPRQARRQEQWPEPTPLPLVVAPSAPSDNKTNPA